MKIAASLCLLASHSVYGFTVSPPPQQVTVSVSTLPQLAQPSQLPSQHELAAASSSATLLSAVAAVAAPPASTNVAAAGVSVSGIFYDGKVPTTEADEYVVVSNKSKSPVDVSGYYIYVATSGTQGATFYFPKDSVIKPGASVRVYTNEIHKETGGYSFGSGKAIWNNRGGLAVMRDNNGKKVCEYKYKPEASS